MKLCIFTTLVFISYQEWDTESEVTLDSWVGQLYEVREDVTVRFPDGARSVYYIL